jgi:transposase-like protein
MAAGAELMHRGVLIAVALAIGVVATDLVYGWRRCHRASGTFITQGIVPLCVYPSVGTGSVPRPTGFLPWS